jgi:hypothetical protein
MNHGLPALSIFMATYILSVELSGGERRMADDVHHVSVDNVFAVHVAGVCPWAIEARSQFL